MTTSIRSLALALALAAGSTALVAGPALAEGWHGYPGWHHDGRARDWRWREAHWRPIYPGPVVYPYTPYPPAYAYPAPPVAGLDITVPLHIR